jgi:hypothetical protein
MLNAATVIGYPDLVSNTDAQHDDEMVYRRLAGENGLLSRAIGNAIVGSTLTWSGRTDLELSPAIDSTDLIIGERLGSAVQRYVRFTSPMNMVIPQAPFVVGNGALKVKNPKWLNSTHLSFTVEPKYRGAGNVWIGTDTLAMLNQALRASGGYQPLSGNYILETGQTATNGLAGAYYYVTQYDVTSGGFNPAALVSAYTAQANGSGIRHSFSTEVEDGVREFLLKRGTMNDGPFVVIGTMAPKGPSRYAFDDPLGAVGDYCEVWEVTTDGDTIRREATRAVYAVEPNPDVVITEEQGQQLIQSQLGQYPSSTSPNHTNPILQWAALIPDESWRSAVQPQADFWTSRGVLAGIFTQAQVNAYGSTQDFVRQLASCGLRYWLRVGDFNNDYYHNNPLYYTGPEERGGNGWSPQSYGSQPQYKLLPVAYALDPSGRQKLSTTQSTPEGPIILDGDVDGDSLSDIAVGIWPAHTPAEAALMGIKQRKYYNQVANGKTYAAWGDFRTLNNNDGAFAQELLEEAIQSLPTDYTVSRVYATDTNGGSDPTIRQLWAVTSLAQKPNSITIMTTTTTRVNWALINKITGWRWSMAPTTTLYPYLSGATCDLVDWDRSEDTATLWDSPRPLFEDAMLDTLHGPACGWGFARGTFVKADQYALLEHDKIAYTYGVQSGGEAKMLAIQNAARLHPEYKYQFMMATYFGDPAMPIKGMKYRATTDVAQQAGTHGVRLTAHRNPSYNSISLSYTGAHQNDQLTIYDLHGRMMWATDLVPGYGLRMVTWNGTTSNGTLAPTGLYLVRSRSGSTLKVTLLR